MNSPSDVTPAITSVVNTDVIEAIYPVDETQASMTETCESTHGVYPLRIEFAIPKLQYKSVPFLPYKLLPPNYKRKFSTDPYEFIQKIVDSIKSPELHAILQKVCSEPVVKFIMSMCRKHDNGLDEYVIQCLKYAADEWADPELIDHRILEAASVTVILMGCAILLESTNSISGTGNAFLFNLVRPEFAQLEEKAPIHAGLMHDCLAWREEADDKPYNSYFRILRQMQNCLDVAFNYRRRC